MKTLYRWQNCSAGLLVALALAACGGGGSGDSATPSPVTPPPISTPPPDGPAPVEPGAPALTSNTATDGLNWLNFRRSQAGLSVLTRNSSIDLAASGHSNYQTLNTVTHVQEVGKQGFTGVNLVDRLRAVGYARPTYFYGEVISASTSNSGVYLAEELITAIYHRFAIFEPRFKEIGAGTSTNAAGYTIFTNNFAANDGYGAGIGKGNIVTWPVNGQVNIAPNFYSDFEEPDPVPNANEVGYPISVHADADVALTVTTFSVRRRGGANLPVKLLSAAADPVHTTTRSAVSIVPLAVLAARTVYEVNFTGTADGAEIAKSWSFTTK